MFPFLRTKKLPALARFGPTAYRFDLDLNRLHPGVDNVRYDVLLSPKFCKAADDLTYRMIARHANIDGSLGIDHLSGKKEREAFVQLCNEVLLAILNAAKAVREVQVDHLAQAAVFKRLRLTVSEQFDLALKRFKDIVWRYDTAHGQHHSLTLELKEKLSGIQGRRGAILKKVGSDLFRILSEIQLRDLQPMRESNFGADGLLPNDIFSNPILHVDNPFDPEFTIQEYSLLWGNRLEDPHRYDTLVAELVKFLQSIDRSVAETKPESDASAPPYNGYADRSTAKYNDMLKVPENIERFFNHFQSRKRYDALKKENAPAPEQRRYQLLADDQKRLFDIFYGMAGKFGLIHRVAAFYQMQPIYRDYCPPLAPYQIVQFLIAPDTRKDIIEQLERLKSFYKKAFPVKPLFDLAGAVKRKSRKEKKKYLLQYLRDLSRFHRDFQNFNRIKDIMARINLVSGEKEIQLSRVNHTLHEFLLPSEQRQIVKPIIRHVVLKADVRGSTLITQQLKERRLNPATHFSLNFFDPISQILPEYDAEKVFIEGDAVILSLYERQHAPGGWYGVARACGAALSILSIVQRHNARNKAHGLPILELGIGVNYQSGPPTFLLEGERQIMISPAINMADRMAGCSKEARARLTGKKLPFNLYVFKPATTQSDAFYSDNHLRFNVNGIELNADGFEKLAEEIDLKRLKFGVQKVGDDKTLLFTGKFPTVSGKYQQIVIREAPVYEIDPINFSVLKPTPEKYYEVCTHPKLYE